MALQKKITLDRYPVCKDYIMIRGKALTFPISNFPGEFADDTVYGVVIDMPMGPQLLTTLVCFINGAANLYFNRGGEYSGASQKYPNVVQVTRAFVLNVGQFLPEAEKITEFDLPHGRMHYIHLLTKGGIYRIMLDSVDVPPVGNPKRLLMAMYQRVMGELRIAQMKDQAAAQAQKG